MSLIGSFFTWCAGSDKRILEECPESEKIKHAGLGTLVCVPAMLSFFSMTYALSTFIDQKELYVLLGTIWFLIVFAYDRYIVSTFRKSIDDNFKHSLKKDIVSTAFITRIILSFFIGFAVGHPLSFRYFDKSIENELNDIKQTKQEEIKKHYLDKENFFNSKIDSLGKKEDEILIEINDQSKLRADEIRGLVKSRYSDRARNIEITTVPGDGPTAKAINANIERLEREKNQLIKKNLSLREEYKDEIKKLGIERDSIVTQVIQPTDYLARVEAMGNLTAKNHHVKVVFSFIVAFLVVVDVLPIIFKVITRVGPYDFKLHALERTYSNKPTYIYSAVDQIYVTILDEIKEVINSWKQDSGRDIKDLLNRLRKLFNNTGTELKGFRMFNVTDTIEEKEETATKNIKNTPVKENSFQPPLYEYASLAAKQIFRPIMLLSILIACSAVYLNLQGYSPAIAFIIPMVCTSIVDVFVKKFQ